MTDTRQVINNIANVSFAISAISNAIGAAARVNSSYTSLTESRRVLERVSSRLQALSQQRRDEIESAIRSNATNCKSLKGIERQLQECVLLIYTSLSNSN